MSFLTIKKQRDFNNEFFNELFSIPSLVVNNSVQEKEVSMDLYEDDDFLKAEIDLPGFDRESLEIDIKDGIVTFRGKREDIEEKAQGNSYYKEIKRGGFERKVSLPFKPKAEDVRAEFINGVLKVEFPKPEKEEPLKVNIKFDR